ncbi:unnamed protein product [Clonostachys byssicola]|uniref:Alpha/beta hydrolase fold-3 domain-containing protein n=1 Tax=Clonostachys byssicola TaxID=160290 RepID=A0A9N9U6I6_9HYPO|nr:unnamed protein product [Clonostachys byssicola]
MADKALSVAGGHVKAREISIPMRDGRQSRALLYQPTKQAETPKPLIVLIHGGGFCYGSADMEAGNCIRAVEAYGCVALSLSYRLAPEAKFPAATDDCWDAFKWITKHAEELEADLSKGFILGGTSAGGNIASVLSHLALDEHVLPPLTGLYLNVPLLLAPEAVPEKWSELYKSRQQNSQSPVLNKAFMDMYTEAYAADVQSHVWSPFNWPGGHQGLPATYFQVCGLDVLRDEALIYEKVLREECGTPTKVNLYPGLPHMFVPNFPTHSSSIKYPEDTTKGLGWLLSFTS